MKPLSEPGSGRSLSVTGLLPSILAVCGHCLPAYTQLQEDICRQKRDFRKKDELVFSSVATAQTKHLALLLNPSQSAMTPMSSSVQKILDFFSGKISSMRSQLKSVPRQPPQISYPALLSKFKPISLTNLLDIVSPLPAAQCPLYSFS